MNEPAKYSEIEKWYSGKALTVIQTYVLPTLRQAEVDGEWKKGDSRKIRAALNKQTVAIRFARKNGRDHNDRGADNSGLLDDVQSTRGILAHESKLRGWRLTFYMAYGQFENARAAQVLAGQLAQYCVNDAERAALATAAGWADDFVAVADLVVLLDSRRPKPVIVCKSLSRLQLDNVGRAMAVDLNNVKPCPMVIVYVTMTNPKTGTTYQIAQPEMHWPEGTRHGTSKFSGGSKAGNQQCESCGHAIKNPFNWVPLLGETPTGPISIWVGRDCAHSLFECEVSGEADYGRT
jgi:hypothetical protein